MTDKQPPFYGIYPACPHCGHTDRPVCCVPVEQPAPEQPAHLGLDVDRIVANYSNPTMRIVKADITALAAEIKRLRGERDELKTRREYALNALGEMTVAFAELQAELAALNSAGIAGWLAEVAE